MKRSLALFIAILLAALPGRPAAAGTDDEYIAIYNLIQEADSLNDASQPVQARAKYTQAQNELLRFRQANPDWNPDAVNFRLNYLRTKIAALSEKAPTTAPAIAQPGAGPAPAMPGPAPAVTLPGPASVPAQPAPPAAPTDWQLQMNALKGQLQQLQADRNLLENKLKEALAAQPATVDPRELAKAEEKLKALEKENDLLSASLAQAKSQPKLPAAPAPAPAPAPAAAPVVASIDRQTVERIQLLESERDDALKKLEAANKALAESKGKSGGRKEARRELAVLRAKLDVFETQKVPYNADELAMLQTSGPDLAATNVLNRAARELPTGMAALVSQAQRYFRDKQYEKAQALYLQVLREDDKNVIAQADYSLIDLYLKRYDEAEKHLKQALALAPDDWYCLLVMGRLRLEQKKNDEAFEALSRAAHFEPQNAEIQNFLGIVLSEKGQHAPAETAFRKALMLNPSYADAHGNLAWFYLNQQPPSVELARWHYQRSLALGLPHNPQLEKLIEARRKKS